MKRPLARVEVALYARSLLLRAYVALQLKSVVVELPAEDAQSKKKITREGITSGRVARTRCRCAS